MGTSYTAPLAFVDEYGQANLDTTLPDVGSHFILTAVLVEAGAVESVRASVDAVRARFFQTGELRAKRLAGNLSRFRQVLEALDEIPFKFYAVVVDKRELQATSGLVHKAAFIKFLSGLLYRKLFGAFPDLQVTADSIGRETFMEGFARYLRENHRQTLFDNPGVTFVDSKQEPLVQLADVVCGVLARAYDSTKTTEQSAELLGLIRNKHALVIDEWPVRYRAASGTGALLAGDPADDEVARYCVARSEEFLERHEGSVEPDTRAQVLVLKKLLYEVRFEDPHSYVSTAAIMQTLEALGESHNEQWLRSTVVANEAGPCTTGLRLHGVRWHDRDMPIYLQVPYAEKDQAKRRGARWDPEKRSWYVPDGVSPGALVKWMQRSNGSMGASSRASWTTRPVGGRAVPYRMRVVVATCPHGHEHRLELELDERTVLRFLDVCPDEAAVPYPDPDLDE